MKKTIILFLLLMIVPIPSRAQHYIRNTTVIDTPTAYTLEKGNYQLSLLAYDNGGMELKAFIGLFDFSYLGISFDMQNAIGKDPVKPNIPGVVAKIKFTDGWEQFPISVAIGYDSFYIGEQGKAHNDENSLDRMIYGPYFVITKPVYVFNDEQHIHFGMRMPAQPLFVPEDTAYFLGLDVPLGETFIFKFETERVYYNFRNPSEWLFNLGIGYTYQERLGVEFGFLMQPGERVNRIIRIEYNDSF
jgi:hypothetical protein